MFYIGIDIAKRSHEACIVDGNGKQIGASISVSNDFDGLENLQSTLTKHNIKSDDAIIGMEATGHYWIAIYSHLVKSGYDVKVINPIISDAYRNMQVRKTKNDKKDAYLIAQIMRFGEYKSTSLAEENTFALRQLTRYRLSLVSECGDLKRKIITVLDQVFPEYETLFSDTFGVTSCELLLKCQTPEDMLKISSKILSDLLAKASRGRFKETKASEVKTLAKQSFGVKFAQKTFSFQLKQMMEQLVFIEKQLIEVEKEIKVLLAETCSVITTIIGVGDVLGATIIGEIGDISRFDSPSKLVAFAGLDVAVTQSGEFTGTKNKISKRGSPYLRRAIWLAAQIAAFSDPALSIYYQKLMAKGKHHYTAIGAISRKLCNIIFAVLRDNKPYVPIIPQD